MRKIFLPIFPVASGGLHETDERSPFTTGGSFLKSCETLRTPCVRGDRVSPSPSSSQSSQIGRKANDDSGVAYFGAKRNLAGAMKLCRVVSSHLRTKFPLRLRTTSETRTDASERRARRCFDWKQEDPRSNRIKIKSAIAMYRRFSTASHCSMQISRDGMDGTGDERVSRMKFPIFLLSILSLSLSSSLLAPFIPSLFPLYSLSLSHSLVLPRRYRARAVLSLALFPRASEMSSTVADTPDTFVRQIPAAGTSMFVRGGNEKQTESRE